MPSYIVISVWPGPQEETWLLVVSARRRHKLVLAGKEATLELSLPVGEQEGACLCFQGQGNLGSIKTQLDARRLHFNKFRSPS